MDLFFLPLFSCILAFLAHMQNNKNKELGGAFLRGTVNLCFEDLQHRTLTANRYFCKDPRKFACVGTFGGK